ncbi:MAG: SRPBCC domain-containing protein [Syntrophales bacterium]|nr:SRPBCC domain-containing protein [Syntrophales bacterium]
MVIEDRFIIKAPLKNVWDFLMGIEGVGTCIPGCEEVKAIDENNFQGLVRVKVGPISGRFKINATMIEIDPPTHLTAIIKGEDKGKASFFISENVLDLNGLSLNETEVFYKSEVSIVGRLATFGDRIIRVKAKQLEENFVKALKGKLEMGCPCNIEGEGK